MSELVRNCFWGTVIIVGCLFSYCGASDVVREYKFKNRTLLEVEATIEEVRDGEEGKKEVRYSFTIPQGTEIYSASDITGRRNLWIPIESSFVSRGAKTIQVVYLPSDPWVNSIKEGVQRGYGSGATVLVVGVIVMVFAIARLVITRKL